MQYSMSLIAIMAASAMAMPQAGSPDSFDASPSPTPTSIPVRTTQKAGLAIVTASGQLPANAASSTTVVGAADAAQATTAGPLSLTITNMWTQAVSVDHASNAGDPTPISAPPAKITKGGSAVQVFPVGYSGNIGIGNNYNTNNSLIEYTVGSTSVNVDVSYVDGFSVPIVCSCLGAVASGCNIDLFDDGNTCKTETSGPVCVNPDHFMNENGPATPFFAPCAHKAFTYPGDNEADATCASKHITCCVGTGCPANNKN